MSTSTDPQRQPIKARSRSALSDISNTIVETFGFSKTLLRKRKQLENAEGPANESEVIEITEEGEESSKEAVVDATVNTASLDQNENTHPQTVSRNLLSAPMLRPSSLLMQEKTQEEIEFDIFGFYQPPKIQRRLPLCTKNADPRNCIDVIDDLYAFYNDMEMIFMPKPYFDKQSEITSRMRTILVDWIAEVHYKYHLTPATLWLTINLMDRYLEKHNIPRNKLQLVGMTALFLACKFEEVHSPKVNDCVYLTDNTYSKEEFIQMESSMLQTLDYQFLVPTGLHFLNRLLNCLRAPERLRLIANYVAERNLQELEVLLYSPRIYAAACIYTALYTVHSDSNSAMVIWSPRLEEESNLKEIDVLPCAKVLMSRIREVAQPSSSKRKLNATKKKYSTAQTQFVGELIFPNL